MPPKGRKAAAASVKATGTATTRSTRGKRAAEAAAEEPKPKSRGKKAAQEEQVDAPKRRGRPAKTAEDGLDLTSMLENLPSIDEEDVIDLTGDADSTSGQAADTESLLVTGLGRGKRPPDFIHHATTGGLRLPPGSSDSVETLTSPEPAKPGRSKKVQADEADPEVITVPKSRPGRAAKATKAESAVVDTTGTQLSETKKRGRAAAAQLQEELDDKIAESAKDAPNRRARAPKAEAERSAASAVEGKPKRTRTASAKKDTEVEAETAEPPAPKAGGRKKATSTTEAETATDETKATSIVTRSAPPKASELTNDVSMKRRTARTANKDEEPKKTVAKTTKTTKGRAAKKDDVAPAADAPSAPARKAGRPKKAQPPEDPEEALPAAEAPVAPVRKGRGRPRMQQPAEATEEPPVQDTAGPVEPVKDKPRASKRVSIAPGPHPEAVTPAKKTPAAPKRASPASIATPETSSSAVKSSGSGKRPAADAEPAEPSSSPAAKRAKRTSTAATAPTEPPSAQETSTRRTTLAGPVTPGGMTSTAQVPKTAPAAAKTRGRPRKSDSSSAKPTPSSITATAKDAETAAEAEEAPPSTKRTKAAPRTSAAGKAAATPKATPKATKTSKPPKTVQPKKTAKVAGTKRKRASSPVPAPLPKRRNQGSPDVEIDVSNRPSLAPATPKITAALQAVIDSRPKSGPAYWLMKAEPESRIEKGQDVKFSIDDLAAVTEPEPWTGVRNHSAKNNMLAMREGDLAFFYHSNSKVPGVVGICEIVGEAVPDETAFDQSHPYFDEKSTREKPTWYNVHVAFRQKFANPDKVSLKAIKEQEELKDMQLVKMTRLSVCMVKPAEWDFIMNLAGETLAEELVEKDWVVVSQEDAQLCVQEEEQVVEEAVNAVADVIEGVAEAVAEQVGDAVAEEAGPEVAAVVADEVAHEVAEAVAEQVAETIEEEAASGNSADMRNRASNIFPPAQITISEDLSFLPDAPALDDDEADELGELPATAASGPAKLSSRRASAGLTPAPTKKKSSSRGSSRAGSRARTLGPAELASTVEPAILTETITYEESTTIPDAGDVSLGEDLLSGFNGTGDDIDTAFLRTPSPERATIVGAINDLRGAESTHGANVGFFGRVSAFLSPGRDTEGEKETEVEDEVAKAAWGDEHEKTKESAILM